MKRLLIGLLLITGATQAQAQAQPKPPASNGEKQFRAQCGSCHMERGWGTRNLAMRVGGDGLLTNRTDLTPSVIKYVVRNGFGSMPHFRQSELSDPLLAEIAAFLAKGNKE